MVRGTLGEVAACAFTTSRMKKLYLGKRLASQDQAAHVGFDPGCVLKPLFAYRDHRRCCVVDLGCGAGEPIVRFFIEYGFNLTGVIALGT